MKRKYNVVYFLKSNISCTTLLIYGWKSLNVFYYVMYMILIDLMRIENTNFLRILFYLYGFVDIQITFLGNLNHAWEKICNLCESEIEKWEGIHYITIIKWISKIIELPTKRFVYHKYFWNNGDLLVIMIVYEMVEYKS